jgi:hypothetical protein
MQELRWQKTTHSIQKAMRIPVVPQIIPPKEILSMQSKAVFAMSIALAWCAVSGKVQSQASNPSSSGDVDSPAAVSAAAQLVPAQALLAQDFDSKKMPSGGQFRVILSENVHLKNGVELPKGTALVGTIVTETAPTGVKAELALRITQADLKDGKSIPIEATIVGIAPPKDNFSLSTAEEESPTSWNGTTLAFDVEGVMSGVDLHSKIAGDNSGVLILTKKNDVKLAARTQIALAIGAQGDQGTGSGL